ncbi:hypothetical protein HPB50_019188 [Hyalomma asiaticum]|uniref:Uncharacterized protein n=1 Tax=Hyalomma asiaticum TaxID=266040 RepID=A0ACB7RPV0_HYAAI|nr:hypothetical protein HPB50_019188 [Hyalomma asiaticum]
MRRARTETAAAATRAFLRCFPDVLRTTRTLAASPFGTVCRSDRLRSSGRRSHSEFFPDDALEWFPLVRLRAADGLPANFEEVALMASHTKQLCFRNEIDTSSFSWLDRISSGPMKKALIACKHFSEEVAPNPACLTHDDWQCLNYPQKRLCKVATRTPLLLLTEETTKLDTEKVWQCSFISPEATSSLLPAVAPAAGAAGIFFTGDAAARTRPSKVQSGRNSSGPSGKPPEFEDLEPPSAANSRRV